MFLIGRSDWHFGMAFVPFFLVYCRHFLVKRSVSHKKEYKQQVTRKTESQLAI